MPESVGVQSRANPGFKSVVKSFGDQNMSSEVYVLGEVSSKVVLGAVAMLCIAVVVAAGLLRSGYDCACHKLLR